MGWPRLGERDRGELLRWILREEGFLPHTGDAEPTSPGVPDGRRDTGRTNSSSVRKEKKREVSKRLGVVCEPWLEVSP